MPQDISPILHPHVPRPNTSEDNSQHNLTTGNAYPPAYNVSSNDPHPTKPVDQDERDYPEIPDNDIGKTTANSAEGNGSNKNVGIGIPQPKESETGNMALFTTIPIVAILGIVLITAATLYLVNKRNKVKKRPVKEIVRVPHNLFSQV